MECRIKIDYSYINKMFTELQDQLPGFEVHTSENLKGEINKALKEQKNLPFDERKDITIHRDGVWNSNSSGRWVSIEVINLDIYVTIIYHGGFKLQDYL